MAGIWSPSPREGATRAITHHKSGQNEREGERAYVCTKPAVDKGRIGGESRAAAVVGTLRITYWQQRPE